MNQTDTTDVGTQTEVVLNQSDNQTDENTFCCQLEHAAKTRDWVSSCTHDQYVILRACMNNCYSGKRSATVLWSLLCNG